MSLELQTWVCPVSIAAAALFGCSNASTDNGIAAGNGGLAEPQPNAGAAGALANSTGGTGGISNGAAGNASSMGGYAGTPGASGAGGKDSCEWYGKTECVDATTLFACERYKVPATYDCGSLGCHQSVQTIAGTEVTIASCAGDTCAQPLTVDVSELPWSLELASLDAYDNDYRDYDCSGIKWRGPEVVIRLTGVTVNQEFFIDASEDAGNERDSLIVIQDECGGTSCLAHRDLLEKLTWTSTVEGDVTIIIDRVDRTPDTVDGAFAVEISKL